MRVNIYGDELTNRKEMVRSEDGRVGVRFLTGEGHDDSGVTFWAKQENGVNKLNELARVFELAAGMLHNNAAHIQGLEKVLPAPHDAPASFEDLCQEDLLAPSTVEEEELSIERVRKYVHEVISRMGAHAEAEGEGGVLLFGGYTLDELYPEGTCYDIVTHELIQDHRDGFSRG